jgi:hypothetical protein
MTKVDSPIAYIVLLPRRKKVEKKFKPITNHESRSYDSINDEAISPKKQYCKLRVGQKKKGNRIEGAAPGLAAKLFE